VKRLGELTGVQSLDGGNPGYGSHKLWISFDRPELSPCLQSLGQESEVYREALAIIRTGQAELLERPEADMPGFRYCAEHQTREDKYHTLFERESVRRKALSEGLKVYDPGIGPSTP
jgi:hypothetical protein